MFAIFPRQRQPEGRCGFTILELMAVIAIIAVLLVFFMPATRSAREAGRRAQCTYYLKQIALALHNYESEYKALPPAYTVDANGRPLHSWRTLILPYMEFGELYKTIDLTKPWNDPVNAKALKTAPGVYRCPNSNAPPNATTYLAIVGADACFLPTEPRRLADIIDGTSNTLMVIEVDDAHAVPWMAPSGATESLVLSMGPKTKYPHPGGMNAGLVDGSVRFLKASTKPEVLRTLMTIAGCDGPCVDPY